LKLRTVVGSKNAAYIDHIVTIFFAFLGALGALAAKSSLKIHFCRQDAKSAKGVGKG